MKIRTLRLALPIAVLLSWQIPSQAEWVQNMGHFIRGTISCFAVSGTNIFAGTNGDGVFLYIDNGASWIEVNNGMTNTHVLALVVNGLNLFAGTNGGGVFLSTNNGTSWTEVNTGLGLAKKRIHSFAANGPNLFAGTSALSD